MSNKPTEELLEWGILEKNSVNEILPTADFLIWLYNQKGNALVHWSAYEENEEYEGEFLKTELNNAILVWTEQVINGKSYVNGPCDEHVDIVYNIITEISNRRMDIHMKKTTSRKVVASK